MGAFFSPRNDGDPGLNIIWLLKHVSMQFFMLQKQRLANQRDIVRGNNAERNLFPVICEEHGIDVKVNYHPLIDIYGGVDACISSDTNSFTNVKVQIKSLSVTLTWG